jgi:hypothetical protein
MQVATQPASREAYFVTKSQTSSKPINELNSLKSRNSAAKAADVIGLYTAPPGNAIVLCVDDKPSIQAATLKKLCSRAHGFARLHRR